jgi:hypothetical protein
MNEKTLNLETLTLEQKRDILMKFLNQDLESFGDVQYTEFDGEDATVSFSALIAWTQDIITHAINESK